MGEYVVLVRRPKKFEGEHVFQTLEELREWLDSKFYARYKKKQTREDMVESTIESLKKSGRVGLTVTAWYGFSIERRQEEGEFSLQEYIQRRKIRALDE